MFVIWEDQKLKGEEKTILDYIKESRKTYNRYLMEKFEFDEYEDC